MASIFSRIVTGEIPCYKVAEDDKHLAFLDAFPIARGHVLVIPKQEVDYIFDLELKDYVALQAFARSVAKAIDQTIDCTRVGMAVIGLEVAHAHIHLVPIDSVADISFDQPKLKLAKEEMTEIAQRIAAKVSLG